ncbi:MAG: hypothetical protein HQL70_04300 [Magnetococcales bacterium]|nr:hypothetical protein [Magnetococcales bacterium]
MERGKSTREIIGLQETECEECNGTGTRLSLDLEAELMPCDWCGGTGKATHLESN